ncbi:MAG: aminotransferase class I/II-fold pyridoxal phosphate-dependent enzyme [Pirellulales bacterium]|nr:aminotransferase class I/II-fold pyridoxal phosphate-dependent enzyme [Pirellulales bacterium]
MIDLASDTLTRPTPGMREAIAAAEVGDDMFDEDPTVQALEARIAKLLGKEDAIYVPSGSMGNLIGIRLHCGQGDEFLAEANCHILRYEAASYAQIFGVTVQAVPSENGILEVDQLAGRIRPRNMHCPQTRLVCLENTHNYWGGRIQPYKSVEAICNWAAEEGVARHLDGARLLNAVVATGIPAPQWAQHFDTVSVCFSKGLGAPVGSALCGTAEAVARARWYRKALGGAMRQAGVIAAGALYALDNHVERLAEDHTKAQVLVKAIEQTDGLALRDDSVDTNIVFFQVAEELGTAADFCSRLREQGIRMLALGPQLVRAVTHLDVSQAEIEEAAEILKKSCGT